jgi:hypothetical protein
VPVEGYRSVNRSRNDLLPTYFARFNRKHRVEVRIHLIPESSDPLVPPHIRTGSLAMHLATNEEGTEIRGVRLEPSELDPYRADWGTRFRFRPKRGFSPRKYAELIGLYREGRGTAYTILLFDEMTEEVERRMGMFRFQE